MRNLQFTGTLYGQRVHLKQVSKKAAKKLFDQLQTVLLIPCNMHPLGSWMQGFPVNKKELTEKYERTVIFEELTVNCEFYNCNKEMGKYLTYYLVTTLAE